MSSRLFRLVSWNVNGFRAISAKPEWSWFDLTNADVVSLQETRTDLEKLDSKQLNPTGWQSHWLPCAVKKGYSGVAVFVRQSRLYPISMHNELPNPHFQGEGRLIHIEFPKFHFFNVYFPNGTQSQDRLDYKMGYYEAFLEYSETLRQKKPIVVCGDFNTAHRPLDLTYPEANETHSGFLPEERAWIDRFIAAGYVDTFRQIHGDKPNCYTWWSYRLRGRKKNIGWRLDYFFISTELVPCLRDAWIESDVFGSDHCPVGISLEIPD